MAAKEGRELVREAVKDARSLKDAALEAAKNELVEQMTPGLKALLEKSIRGSLVEKRGVTGRIGQSQRGDHFSPKSQKWEEGKEKGDQPMAKEKEKGDEQELDLESLSGFFPQMSEEPDPDADPDADPMSLAGMHGLSQKPMAPKGKMEDADPDPDADPAYEAAGGMGIPALGEDADPDADPEMKEGAGEVDEEIEINEAELRKIYDSALQTEAQVSKGFKDMTPAGELDKVHKDISKGIQDLKSGDKAWEKEVPPDHVDYQIKETIIKGLQENKLLRGKLVEAVKLIKSLGAKLHEVNLFNSKVLHVNRILNQHGRLTKEQKRVVLESIDKAQSIQQVKVVYETIVGAFGAAGTLTESKSRKPLANAQGRRTSGEADKKVLSESADRGQQGKYGRMQQLAGLLK